MRRSIPALDRARRGRFDYELTSEEYKQIQKEVVTAVRPPLKARQLFGPWYSEPKGIGVQEYGYDTLSEMSAAEIAMNFKDPDMDVMNITRANVKVPILEKAFLLPRRTVESARREGRNLEALSAERASYQVAKLENTFVFQGWSLDGGSTYEINGFYQGAGSDFSTAADYGTAGKAIVATSGAIALSEAQDIYGPYMHIYNAVQLAQLNASVLSSGVREKEIVRDLLNDDEDDLPTEGAPFKGKITRAPHITAGTALQIGNHPKGAAIIRCADIQVEDWPLPPKGVAGLVWESLVPLIYDSYTFTKLSGI